MIPPAAALETPRFLLEPLGVRHADEMVGVLADPELHRFTGGEAPTLDELRARYARQTVGRSPEGSAGWLNLVIRDRASREAVGFVQATVTRESGALVAEMAWLVAREAQGSGAASECASAVLRWLVEAAGAEVIRAHIHPDHAASAGVAGRLGLVPTDVVVDGEARWELALPEQRG